ncbi:ABC transporter ATP-binding protein [Amphritea sp.]|uniref:ABC transporter ATP-binding protein n=1 Tax=Amphritea sp. TaxID=1872502 RepID=UPI003A8EBEA6
MFNITNATGGYGKTTIIQDIDIQVQPGEVVALLGRNGVGKSTLMKYAAGHIPPMGGSVCMDGQAVAANPTQRAKSGIGYVPQGRFVFPRMSVVENIAVAASANGYPLQESVDELLSFFPMLKPKAHDLAGGLSGGQQQVLALARALAIRPKILLLDEPTEGVQPSIIDEMAGILKQINQDWQISMLVAEQDLDFCLSISSRAYIMEKGQIRRALENEALKEDKVLQQELLGV